MAHETETLRGLGREEQLAELKRIALDEGILKAVSLAKKLESPYLLDELHDSLVGELKRYLVEEGKLEEL
jgi:hypothetical protein